MIDHKARAHSMFSASGAERWHECAYSVAAEAGKPDVDTPWSKEGTLAHEALEAIILRKPFPESFDFDKVMEGHCFKSAQKIRSLQIAFPGSVLLVEKRVYASFIHPEMFGTCDYILADKKNRTLHILDFKYGQGHVVRAERNKQLLQYALSVAESYGWEIAFDHVKMWVLQPRVGPKGFDSWCITMKELKEYWWPVWVAAVKRVEAGKGKPTPGAWCHWCKAKHTCPAKAEKRVTELTNMFEQPLNKGQIHGKQKESEEFKKAVKSGKAEGKEKGVKTKEEKFI